MRHICSLVSIAVAMGGVALTFVGAMFNQIGWCWTGIALIGLGLVLSVFCPKQERVTGPEDRLSKSQLKRARDRFNREVAQGRATLNRHLSDDEVRRIWRTIVWSELGGSPDAEEGN